MDRVTESSSSAKESTWEMSGISSLSSQVDSAKIQKSPSTRPIRTRGTNLEDVFSENILAKILQVAQRGLETEGPLPSYPESVPQSGASKGQFEYRDAQFWTCGFFPGSIFALLERAAKFPAHLGAPEWYRKHVYADLLKCGRHWSEALHHMSSRTDTHDMGFIVQPALQRDWELTGNPRGRESVTRAAYALASRFSPLVGAIRSWDRAISHRYRIEDMTENFLVIIDSMCNLDLLFYIGHLVQDESLISIATAHANTVRSTLVRQDFSTFHLVNLEPGESGAVVKSQMTHQGYEDHSTWSRGQAWAIMGFAQTYLWTREPAFLETAVGCANMFLSRLDAFRHHHHHPFVPVWDFDAPQPDPAESLRDTSAGVIAANGMVLIHQALQSQSDESHHRPVAGCGHDFLDAALLIVQDTLDLSLDREPASLSPPDHPATAAAAAAAPLHAQIVSSSFDAILRNATANNNEHAIKRYWDHGLVYADYYLLEFGNKLCRMGVC